MIANPEVANIFRQRAKVGDLFLTFFYGGIFKIIYPWEIEKKKKNCVLPE